MKSVQSVGGRVALIPWVMFAVTGVITSVGAVVPAAVAIIAPIGMGFAQHYKIRPLLMGLMVINGTSAGGFSPLSIFGGITNGVVERNDLPSSPIGLFLSSMLLNIVLGLIVLGLIVLGLIVLGLIVFVLFGGRELIGKRDRGEGIKQAEGGTPSGIPSGSGRTGTSRTPITCPAQVPPRCRPHPSKEVPASRPTQRSTATG